MFVIRATDVNDAYVQGYKLLDEVGVREDSRAGEVLRSPEPVTTRYTFPTRRVLFEANRDANPFFHLFEALWILAGRQDVQFLTQFNKRMAEFSDDGFTFHGAYGARLRGAFDNDSLTVAVRKLKKDPNSRRVYCGIWDPIYDLETESKDIPCNLGIKFEIQQGALHAIVYNRSNDMIWGAYGANIVQFSMIQEYVAARLRVPVGSLTQVSGNFHAYTAVYEKHRAYTRPLNPYETGEVEPFPLVEDPKTWDEDLHTFLADPASFAIRNIWFHRVGRPMWFAWSAWKKKDFQMALAILENCVASDWRLAATQWLLRRVKA